MSRRKANVTVESGWLPTDTILVYHGTENAVSLAASPTTVRISRLKVGGAAVGAVLTLEFDYSATDICGKLPMGVSMIDAAGNESSRTEGTLYLMDPPDPPGRPDVAATANPGEATLTWLASPDL